MEHALARPASCTAAQIHATLADSLQRIDGCALCDLVRRLEYQHIIRFGTARLRNAEDLQKLCAGRALCNSHFWETGRCFGNRWFADTLFDLLRILPADLGLASSQAAFTVESLPLHGSRCWVCHELAQDMADYVAALDRLLKDAAFQLVYERSRGLCLPHIHALTAAASPEVRAWVRSAELAHWERLKQELAESARKKDRPLWEQQTPSERTAPTRCIQKLVGAHGCPWPSEP